MPFDTDGTHWMTVRYTLDVSVMADTAEEALRFADLALPDYEMSDLSAEVIDEWIEDLSAEVMDADRISWIIQDWAGRRLWSDKEFGSFEDGWSHIYTECPEPDRNSPEWLDGWFDDFYVVPIKEEKSND